MNTWEIEDLKKLDDLEFNKELQNVISFNLANNELYYYT